MKIFNMITYCGITTILCTSVFANPQPMTKKAVDPVETQPKTNLPQIRENYATYQGSQAKSYVSQLAPGTYTHTGSRGGSGTVTVASDGKISTATITGKNMSTVATRTSDSTWTTQTTFKNGTSVNGSFTRNADQTITYSGIATGSKEKERTINLTIGKNDQGEVVVYNDNQGGKEILLPEDIKNPKTRSFSNPTSTTFTDVSAEELTTGLASIDAALLLLDGGS